GAAAPRRDGPSLAHLGEAGLGGPLRPPALDHDQRRPAARPLAALDRPRPRGPAAERHPREGLRRRPEGRDPLGRPGQPSRGVGGRLLVAAVCAGVAGVVAAGLALRERGRLWIDQTKFTLPLFGPLIRM